MRRTSSQKEPFKVDVQAVRETRKEHPGDLATSRATDDRPYRSSLNTDVVVELRSDNPARLADQLEPSTECRSDHHRPVVRRVAFWVARSWFRHCTREWSRDSAAASCAVEQGKRTALSAVNFALIEGETMKSRTQTLPPEGLPMSAATKFGWFAVLGLMVVALFMFFTAVGHTEQLTLAERLALLVPRFGAKGAELVDAQEFGTAIDGACKHERECAARLMTMAILESGLRRSVSLSEYKDHEGDSFLDRNGVRQHKAWGSFQQHKSRLNADVWGDDDLLVQARSARSMQLGALAECRKFRGVVPEVGMWRILSGRGCMAQYSGEEARMAMLARVRRAL